MKLTRTKITQHLKLKQEQIEKRAGKEGLKKMWEELEKCPEGMIEHAYREICEQAAIAPLSTKRRHAYETDLKQNLSTRKMAEELRTTLEWALGKLKECDKEITLQDLSTQKMEQEGIEFPGDITLYLVFEQLTADEAADGIAPYAIDEEGEKIHHRHTEMVLRKGPKITAIKSSAILLQQDHERCILEGKPTFTAKWETPRKPSAVFLSAKNGEEVADEAFFLTNSPVEDPRMGDKERIPRIGPSLSVGDVVEVRDIESGKTTAYLCASVGWEEKTIEKGVEKPKQETKNLEENLAELAKKENSLPNPTTKEEHRDQTSQIVKERKKLLQEGARETPASRDLPTRETAEEWLKSKMKEKAIHVINRLIKNGSTGDWGERYHDDLAGTNGLGQLKNPKGTNLGEILLKDFLKENPEMTDDLNGSLEAVPIAKKAKQPKEPPPIEL
jgi:hypothetical protein